MYYHLDPKNNLPKTNERITQYFCKTALTLNVKNTTGRELSGSECEEAIGCDIFMYFGHGTGINQHNNIQNNKKKKNMFLFGCSSSRLLCVPNFKRHSFLMEYLNSVNVFIGCLWDVTDHDLDKFAMELMDILIVKRNLQIVEVVRMARKSMKLRYMNGAAVVVWGYPTIFEFG